MAIEFVVTLDQLEVGYVMSQELYVMIVIRNNMPDQTPEYEEFLLKAMKEDNGDFLLISNKTGRLVRVKSSSDGEFYPLSFMEKLKLLFK